MTDRIKPYLEPALGNTWCIVTGFARIPLYMPDRQNAVMIDSGLKRDRDGILSLLEKEHIRVGTLLTSHYHRDHVENHPALKAAFGCDIWMSPYADAVCRDKTTLRSGSYESLFMTLARGGPFVCSADRLIYQQDTVVHTPVGDFPILRLSGHAQEHIGFVTPDDVAYLGDTILSEDVLHAVRIPYCTYCAGDLEAKEAVARMDHKLYILAHNGVRESIRELAIENHRNLLQKADMVASLCNSYMTKEQLAAKLMAHTAMDTASPLKVFGAERNVQVMIEYLIETGCLKLRARDGFVEYIRQQ